LAEKISKVINLPVKQEGWETTFFLLLFQRFLLFRF
jgi:hypothetical protein